MTRDLDSTEIGATVVVVRDPATAAAKTHNRHRAGALRGGSRYLGAKGQNLRLFDPSQDHRAAATLEPRANIRHAGPSAAETPMTEPDPNEPPRLYHGLPSGEEQGDMPVESTRVIHSLESELSLLAGRLQRRTPGDAPPSVGAVGTPAANALEPDELPAKESPSPAEPPAYCQPIGRWDNFGRDSRFLEQFSPLATFLTKRYFRTEVTGLEHIPTNGPCLLVANHSGALPIDGLVLKSAIWAAHPAHRHIRWLTEDFVQNLPFVGTYLQRLGAVRASRENVLHLLQNGECVVAFPEGFKGYAKPVAQWYRVQRLGRGRIVGLCLQAGVPLLPCAIVGGEEATPSIRRLEAVERWLGTPYFPITPTFPWLGPFGLLPAPTRWRIDIGPSFLSGHEPGRSEDPLYVADLTVKLRSALQQRLDRLVAQRKSTWAG